MTGKYDIVLYNNKVHFKLTVRRNITVLRGNSASGKSELIRLLTAYNNFEASSGITLICEKKCVVLNEGNWKLFTEHNNDCIFFADEGNHFLKTREFANVVKGSDNYFVLISREKLSQLPYSVDEIYGLREGDEAGRYHNPKRIFNEMYRIFGKMPDPVKAPDIVVTEDSNSGNELFDILFPGKCISSRGKTNIKRVLTEHPGQSILAVIDGAAFGPEMQDCMDIISGSNDIISLFAPESFEYLILQAGIIEVPKAVLEETWNYADSVKYFSWEDFYTHYLSDATRNGIGQYSKAKLNEYYKTKGNVDKIVSALPECIKNLL